MYNLTQTEIYAPLPWQRLLTALSSLVLFILLILQSSSILNDKIWFKHSWNQLDRTLNVSYSFYYFFLFHKSNLFFYDCVLLVLIIILHIKSRDILFDANMHIIYWNSVQYMLDIYDGCEIRAHCVAERVATSGGRDEIREQKFFVRFE